MDEFSWIGTEIDVYASLAFERSNCIWLGKFISPCQTIQVADKTLAFLSTIFRINHVGTRETTIRTCIDWLRFIDTCYSLSCDNCQERGWSAPEGIKQKFRTWMENSKAREKANDQNQDLTKKCAFFKYHEAKFRENNIILTVFDDRRSKRLIIDGLHRAAALTMACEEEVTISDVKILECYGEHVEVIFPLDVHQLPNN